MSDEKVALMIGVYYAKAMDNCRDRLKMCLDEKTELNWFGRTLIGPNEIASFLKETVPATRHYVNYVLPCPPRSAEVAQSNEPEIGTVETTEPFKQIEVNDSSMNLLSILSGDEVKMIVPLRNRLQPYPIVTPSLGYSKVDVERKPASKPKAIILQAKLCFSTNRKRTSANRKLDHIYVEYEDSSITYIAYVGTSNCRRNLSALFNEM